MTLNNEDLLKLVGTQCGRLTIVEYLGFYINEGSKEKKHWYRCLCSCGRTVNVSRTKLKGKGKTISCGCSLSTHGCSKHGAYNSYKAMIGRVKRPHPYYHKQYIAKGIGVCEEWDGHPEVFCKWADENGFKKGLTLDRIDNDGDYTPENCRWVTPLVQSNNRSSYNYNIEYHGRTQSLAAWARELGMNEGTLRDRLKKQGMSISEAFETPINKKFSPIKNAKN